MTFCQRLTAPNQKEQSLYWCSLSCSDDILSTFDSPKSKGPELVLVFFILQWRHFVNVWQPQIKRTRACIDVRYLAVTFCQCLTAPNQNYYFVKMFCCFSSYTICKHKREHIHICSYIVLYFLCKRGNKDWKNDDVSVLQHQIKILILWKFLVFWCCLF